MGSMTRRLPGENPDGYPPPTVWSECEGAARRAEELRKGGREVHFELARDSGGVVIQLRDLHGASLRELRAGDAVAIAYGAPA